MVAEEQREEAAKPKQREPPREWRRVRLDDIALHDLTYQLRVETRAGDLRQSLQDEGQLEPVHLVGSAPFQLVDGFRRCTAAKALGWTEVTAFVHEQLDDLHAFKLAFIHNVVRKNLRPIDKANPIRLALKRGMKKLDVAEQFGLSERQVTRYLVLLKLRSEVLDAIDERGFTMEHALLKNRSHSQEPCPGKTCQHWLGERR